MTNSITHYVNKRNLINWIVKVGRFAFIMGLSFLIIYPIFVKLSTSFKSNADLFDPTVLFIPRKFTLMNFEVVIKSVDYFKTIFFTVWYDLLLVILQVFSCTFVAYGLARFKFPGNKLVFGLVIFTMVIPTQTILLPLYLKFRFFNIFEIFKFSGSLSGIPLTDTIIPFVLLSLTAVAFKNGLYVYLLRQHFKNVPVVLEEAAYIDGCGVFKTFFRIILPGAIPIILTVFLFSFVWTWNDYYYTNILAPSLPTLNVKLQTISLSSLGANMDMYSNMLNAPKFLLLIAPLVILYFFTQRFFMESIQKSGIVG